jgi:hypothetical protein
LVCYHSINDIPCPYTSKLKGASAVNQQQQKQLLVFNPGEVNFLAKSLEVCRYYITKNQQMFQQPQDIIKELTTASNILSTRSNKNNNNKSNLKGASDNPFKSLDNIRKMVGLTTSNESLLNLKGASNSTPQNKNNTCSKKEHLKDLLKQFNLI